MSVGIPARVGRCIASHAGSATTLVHYAQVRDQVPRDAALRLARRRSGTAE